MPVVCDAQHGTELSYRSMVALKGSSYRFEQALLVMSISPCTLRPQWRFDLQPPASTRDSPREDILRASVHRPTLWNRDLLF